MAVLVRAATLTNFFEVARERGLNPLPLLRWSHLLDRLETALDGAGRIAGILESLVIKHA